MIRSIAYNGILMRTRSLRPILRVSKLSSVSNSCLCLSDTIGDAAIANNLALVDETRNISLTYAQLNKAAAALASEMTKKSQNMPFTAVGAFNKPSVSFVISMLAAWKLGKIFVPLSTTHSESELTYFVGDSKVGLICCASKSDVNPAFLQSSHLPVLETSPTLHSITNSSVLGHESSSSFQRFLVGEDSKGGSVNGNTGALVIYTSGTTGRPKGVLHTHRSVAHMVGGLVESWKYTSDDKILHYLPLYHVHGLVNKLLCVLSVGGTVEFTGSAAASVLWKRLALEEQRYQAHLQARERGQSSAYKPLSLFMAVPTVYARMLESASEMSRTSTTAAQLADAVKALQRMRLMVCGSAALPDNVLLSWEKLTGYRLLERYGMTEIGMALSNPYQGERRQGYVGFPLPNVECRLVDDGERTVLVPNTPGELRIKGPQLFSEYLNRPDATRDTFDEEGWFKTGDIAEVAADGYYKILGRSSSDIIKSAGYKLSALEIERELLAHPQILETAVVGVPDDILGEKVLAVIALRSNVTTDTDTGAAQDLVAVKEDSKALLHALRVYLQDKLAAYKQPREYVVVDAIPRNHLGKVNKKSLLKDLKMVVPPKQ